MNLKYARSILPVLLLSAGMCVPIAGFAGDPPTDPGAPAETGDDDVVGPSFEYLDSDGRPLPFQDHASIRKALLSGRVLSREKIGRGVAGVEKVLLESGGVQFHAAFRMIDVRVRAEAAGGSRRGPKEYRDSAIFESAAYELSQLLGLNRVPPVVERTVGDEEGTLQIWLEGTKPEIVLIEEDRFHPPDVPYFNQQKEIMWVFDNLIANSDRNQGNLLFGSDWTLWLIDHSRAFRQSSRLRTPDRLNRCERRLWSALQDIEEETLRTRLDPYLERHEMSNLIRRKDKLIKHFQGLIDKHGEEKVLYDLQTAAAPVAR